MLTFPPITFSQCPTGCDVTHKGTHVNMSSYCVNASHIAGTESQICDILIYSDDTPTKTNTCAQQCAVYIKYEWLDSIQLQNVFLVLIQTQRDVAEVTQLLTALVPEIKTFTTP